MDDDCTMWTLGAFCNPRLDPYEVFERTDVMAGPSHEPANVTKMVIDLAIGDGQYVVLDTLEEARRYMVDSMFERFAVGVSDPVEVGHMVCAYRSGEAITYRDFQIPPHDGQTVPTPGGRCQSYFVWPIVDE